jgi:hypothetical protein
MYINNDYRFIFIEKKDIAGNFNQSDETASMNVIRDRRILNSAHKIYYFDGIDFKVIKNTARQEHIHAFEDCVIELLSGDFKKLSRIKTWEVSYKNMLSHISFI